VIHRAAAQNHIGLFDNRNEYPPFSNGEEGARIYPDRGECALRDEIARSSVVSPKGADPGPEKPAAPARWTTRSAEPRGGTFGPNRKQAPLIFRISSAHPCFRRVGVVRSPNWEITPDWAIDSAWPVFVEALVVLPIGETTSSQGSEL